MTFAIGLLIITSFLLLVVSTILKIFHNHLPYEKDRSYEMTQLLSESLRSFLKRALSSVGQILIYLTIVILLFSLVFKTYFSWLQILTFFLGAGAMSLSLVIALMAVPKVLPAILHAAKGYLADTITILFKSTTCIAFTLTGIPLLGLAICYMAFGRTSIIGYALGMMVTAYFFRIGGGVYKAGANIGANIVSRIDQSIPNFDRRNPGTILDIAGDCIGEMIGFSSDIFSSFILVLISTILFPYALSGLGLIDAATALKLEQLPFYIVSSALIISIFSFLISLVWIRKNYSNFLLEGIYVSIAICSVVTFAIIHFLHIQMNIASNWGLNGNFSLYIPYFIGLIGAFLIAITSDILTSNRFLPTQKIAKSAEYGPVMALLGSFSNGLKSTGLFLIYLLLVLIPSFYFAGVYGIMMVGLGMLSMTSTILLTHIFHPIAANLYKISVISDSHQTVIKHTNKIEHLGQTTSSLGNGFSTGVAVISSFCLLQTMIVMLQKKIQLASLLYVDIYLLIGLLIGIMLPFVFSGFLLKGLTKAILAVINEVKRQFRDISYLYEDKARPDMIKASDLHAENSMNALTFSTIVMVFVPLLIAYMPHINGLKVLVGIVLGSFLTGSTMGFFLANLGDMLTHAKHYIAKGHFGGTKAATYENIALVDHFGDAFTDVVSPGINILIKAMGILTILVIYLLLF